MRGPRPGPAVTVGAAVAVAAIALVAVAVRGPAAPPSFEQRVHDIAAGLRCPVCQDLSVADSPSPLAQQMRDAIARRLRAGESRRRIDGYFVSKYGRWILLSPSTGGLGIVAWGAPGVALIAGGAIAFAVLRRRRPEADP